ncbi:hypothetical protein ACFQX7_31990 [Luedemannella flava]
MDSPREYAAGAHPGAPPGPGGRAGDRSWRRARPGRIRTGRTRTRTRTRAAAPAGRRGDALGLGGRGEWSDPTGWSGSGWTAPDPSTSTEPYAPVPGAPGVFGLHPDRQPAQPGPAAGPSGRPPGGPATPRDDPNQRPAPIPPDAPLYIPEQYDSGGWAAAASNEQTEPQTWSPPRQAGAAQPQVWAPPGWQGPAEPAWETDRSRGRRTLLIVASIVGLIVLAAGTVVAMQALAPSATDANRGGATGAPPASASPPPASPSAAPSAPPTKKPRSTPPPTTVASGQTPATGTTPTRLKLTDEGTSVTITWQDPSDGTVPFIVAGARSGEESHPMQSIPAGRTRSTIHGLNTRYDYCFTVAAVYSIDVVARSTQVCTHRLSTATTP